MNLLAIHVRIKIDLEFEFMVMFIYAHTHALVHKYIKKKIIKIMHTSDIKKKQNFFGGKRKIYQSFQSNYFFALVLAHMSLILINKTYFIVK